MLFVVIPYTASIVLANQVGDAQSPTKRKFRYVLEEMHIVTIWVVKACLLVLYWRILYVVLHSFSHAQSLIANSPVQRSILRRRSLQGIAVFCCASFAVVQLSLLLWCQPVEARQVTVAVDCIPFVPIIHDCVTNPDSAMHVLPQPHRLNTLIRRTEHDPHHDPPCRLHTNTTPYPSRHSSHNGHIDTHYRCTVSVLLTLSAYQTQHGLPPLDDHRVQPEHHLRQSSFPYLTCRYCRPSAHTPIVAFTMAAVSPRELANRSDSAHSMCFTADQHHHYLTQAWRCDGEDGKGHHHPKSTGPWKCRHLG
jgi:hypothetical protein